jgi:hypothetical protein
MQMQFDFPLSFVQIERTAIVWPMSIPPLPIRYDGEYFKPTGGSDAIHVHGVR